METFTLIPRGPFSLAASIRFLEGFTPAWYSNAPNGVLELAFPAEGSWRTVGVRVSQAGEKVDADGDRKSTRLNSSHTSISYAVFCLDRKSVV